MPLDSAAGLSHDARVMGNRTRGGLHKVCGCARARWTKCRHPWHFAFQHQGRPYRFSLAKQTNRPAGSVMTKAEAEALADAYRTQIRAGTFRQSAAPAVPVVTDTRLTVADVARAYVTTYAPIARDGQPRRAAGRRLIEWYTEALMRVRIPAAQGGEVALGDKPIADVTAADVEAVRAHWPRKAHGSRGGAVGPTRALRRLRHLFNWAIARGHLDHSPFRRGDVVVVPVASRDGERTRRLEAGEDERLLTGAAERDPWLYALIVTLLETGMRVGEALALTWADVSFTRGTLLVRAATTKTGLARDVPMTAPVRAVLLMRQQGPDGVDFPPGAYVFGNAVGERVKDARRPWERLRQAVGLADLHLHDLRREFACRLRESGAPDHEVAAWLGHANISTTSTYLRTNRTSMQHALKRFEQARPLCKAVVNTLAEVAQREASRTADDAPNSFN
jgi:integrase